MAVNDTADQFSEGNGFSLSFTGRVAEAIHQRHMCVVQMIGGRLDGFGHGGRLAVDQGVGEEPFRGVVLEPRFAENASTLRLDDSFGVGMQLDIVTHAAAKGAGRVLYYVEFHRLPGGRRIT